jgi:hypothetical protein
MQKNANTIALRQAVESYQRLSVDDYQRTYQWGLDQIDDLMMDLTDTIDAQDDHFFGTLILQDSDDRSAIIVDGQQRLTTVFVMVATLRDEIASLGKNEILPEDPEEMPINVSEKTRNFLYFSNKFSDLRLTPNRFVKDLFEETVMAIGEKKKPIPQKDRLSTLAFRKAVGHIRSVISADLGNLEGSERLSRINRILETLLDHFLVLRVPTASLDESMEIFLTLNDRGQALGPSDLVRGDILMAQVHGLLEKDKRKLQERVTTEWEGAMETVLDPETFLRHFLVAKTGTKVQKKRVVKTVKEIIAGATQDAKKTAAAAFWQDLLSDADIYGEIVRPSGSGNLHYLLELVQPLAKSQRIMLLPVLREVDDPVTRLELVRLIVVLAFRWVVAGGNAQKLEDFFQEQCGLSDNKDFAEILKKNLHEKIGSFRVDSNGYFNQEAGNSYVVRALLFAVDKMLRGGANPIAMNPGAIHMEHIAPQKPTEHWLEKLGLRDEPESYISVVNLPGNLTLLDQKLNIRAKQKPFSEKKSDEYSKSNVHITREFGKLSDWSLGLVKDRTVWLAEMFDLAFSPNESDAKKVIHFHEWREAKV